MASLKLLNENNLDRLEKAIDEEREVLLNLNCAHAETYKGQKKFKFLTGHRIVILKWCETLNDESHQASSNETFNVNHPAFSPIMRCLILDTMNNFGKPPNTNRYAKLLMDFSIYIYIMAGKATYEILSKNMALPAPSTIGKPNFSS